MKVFTFMQQWSAQNMLDKYIHTFIHTYIQTYIYIYIYMYTYIHTCMHAYMHTYIHTYTHIHIYTYIHIHICIYVYMCIYKNITLYIYNGCLDILCIYAVAGHQTNRNGMIKLLFHCFTVWYFRLPEAVSLVQTTYVGCGLVLSRSWE